MENLALLDKVLHRSGDILYRHGRVDTVLVVEIDMVGPQPRKRLLNNPADARRTTVEGHGAIDGKAELRGDLHLVANGLERFTDQLFVDVGPVNLRGVEEGHAVLERLADRADALLFRHGCV